MQDEKSYTDKKNQHYIPKFYLRNFSYKLNGKQIGLYNLKADFFYQTGKLKTQGSKSFFYGYDGVIEDHLSQIEGNLAKVITEIISTKIPPARNSDEHEALLVFVGLTLLRNPVLIENIKEQSKHLNKRLNEDLLLQVKKEYFPETDHDEAIGLALTSLPSLIEMIIDLDYKLLINKTNQPFISSDFPIVKYNQFLENKKWPHGKTGFGTVGLQILAPLSPDLTIILYDRNIYKVGHKKQRVVDLIETKDVDQLNILQILNCFESIFFNEGISEHYIRTLLNKSKNYVKPNQTKSNLTYLLEKGKPIPEHKNLIVIGSTDCEIKLTLSNINIHSKGKKHSLTNSVSQLRPLAQYIMNKRQ